VSPYSFFRRDRRGEIRFEIEVVAAGSEFVATVTRVVRIHGGGVPRPMRHTFAEHRGSTEKEALDKATGEVDSWITVFGAEEA
jgi:hypothetical protein